MTLSPARITATRLYRRKQAEEKAALVAALEQISGLEWAHGSPAYKWGLALNIADRTLQALTTSKRKDERYRWRNRHSRQKNHATLDGDQLHMGG